jgi:hypothetical protein
MHFKSLSKIFLKAGSQLLAQNFDKPNMTTKNKTDNKSK